MFIDFDWLIRYKKSYPDNVPSKPTPEAQLFILLATAAREPLERKNETEGILKDVDRYKAYLREEIAH